MKTKTLAETAKHTIDIYLQLPPPVTAKEFDRIASEIRANTPATSHDIGDGYRWRFIAGNWSVSCEANWLAAQNMADKMRKRDYRNTHNRIPRTVNMKQYTALQYDAALKRTPELEQ